MAVTEKQPQPVPMAKRRTALWADLRRYALTSAFSLAIILGSSAAFHELVGLSETLAVALALTGALIINFTMLRRFVFPGQAAPPTRQFLETAVISLTFRAFEYGIFLVLNLGAGVDYLPATGAAVCVSALGKFIVYRQVVFNRAR